MGRTTGVKGELRRSSGSSSKASRRDSCRRTVRSTSRRQARSITSSPRERPTQLRGQVVVVERYPGIGDDEAVKRSPSSGSSGTWMPSTGTRSSSPRPWPTSERGACRTLMAKLRDRPPRCGRTSAATPWPIHLLSTSSGRQSSAQDSDRDGLRTGCVLPDARISQAALQDQ